MRFRNAPVRLLITLCVLLTSCRLVDPHGPTDVTLEVENTGYFAGQTVNLMIGNFTGGTIHYNLCYARLERRASDEWIPVEMEDTCDEVTFTLEHGEQATYEYHLEESIPADTYRFVYSFAPAGDDELTLITSSFDISRT